MKPHAPSREVALKITRRRYAKSAVNEIAVHHAVARTAGRCPSLIHMEEAFLWDGHLCIAYPMGGPGLDGRLEERGLAWKDAIDVSRQLLDALAHLHSAGFVHTDIKPDNVLCTLRPRRALLADLGNAHATLRQGASLCTREYTPPEVILGAPLSPALDLWSMACTLFEVFTGELLFAPRREAARRYREFSDDDADADVADPEPPPELVADEAEERAEQRRRGELAAGKYRLVSRLGQGKFGTVWRAVRENDSALDGSYETLAGHAKAAAAKAEPSPKDMEDDAWRRARGADDVYDLALNFEHLVLMAGLGGPLPPALTANARYGSAYLEPDGTFRFARIPEAWSLHDRLLPHVGPVRAPLVARFLAAGLHLDPANRPSAEAWRHSPDWHACENA